ncbi:MULTISPECIES: flagellar hook-associated protein FlgK [unclassified Rhizobium]|uniref:flagellar hook-associated protein FlgK n=1 Tax=unclassified Rhizobium TaxID=2613769 RepID=UPI0002715C61|nr:MULTISPECIES: flagellar hook-associated protein FlgK [unclassified Rhizobium]EJL53199.1 flagellar hook-associated protein FlgK [Rhizobium sp. CF122]MBB3393939.1 flagellar hook-associated protein 1 FlgK [Rhizobium sp. BK060]MBB4169080.1 flagellar hook-associated protein 1 FlgK [Rhizobium sp. BK538]TCM80622.1 flagellar hook-associated protein 1 FlgK [Rhizobium sp. BK068]
MSLTSALNTAQSIFSNTGTQSSVVSNNISNSSNSDYVRRQAMITTSLNGAQVVKISRAQEDALLRQWLKASAQDSGQQTLLSGLTDLKSIMGGNDYETSPANYLATFREKLQAFRTSPSSTIAAQSAVTAAQDVANSLNDATKSVQAVRQGADKEIATQVSTLNTLLAQFKTANDAVKSATATGGNPADALDERDKLLKQISSIVGVNAVDRDNGDMALYTTDGTVVFDTIPRTITFVAQNTYTAQTKGNGVYIDGVLLGAGKGSTSTAQGSLQALLQVRDEVATTFQSQLDEIAKSLVTMFSETGGTPATTQPGLFVWKTAAGTSGGTPTTTGVIDGIAGTITVNAAVITSQGGDPMKLRDGSISGLTNLNTTNSSGFSDNLDALYTAMGTAQTFSAAAGLSSNVNIMDYASSSVGWLEQYRSDATTASENTSAALSRSTEAYSNETGVNLDEELTLLLDIEQSYKAATKILNAVDEMLKSLLDIAS